MRITGGQAKGRRLPTPLAPGVRPTSSRVREALFSMLGTELGGLTFLDAFGGAGLMGLEAWSRGAVVTVVEKNPRAFKDLVGRGQSIGADWSPKRGDVLKMIARLGTFDIVYADPPYAMDMMPILEALSAVAKDTLIAESLPEFKPPTNLGGFSLERHRVYGGCALSIYRK